MADDNGPKVVDESFPGWLVPAMALLGFLALANLWIGLKNSSYTEDSRHALNSDMQTLKLGHAKDLRFGAATFGANRKGQRRPAG